MSRPLCNRERVDELKLLTAIASLAGCFTDQSALPGFMQNAVALWQTRIPRQHAEVICVPTNLCARIAHTVTYEAAVFIVASAIAMQAQVACR